MGLFIATLLVAASAFGEEGLFDTKAADEHFQQGLSAYGEKDYAHAIEEFSQVIAIDPDDIRAYYYIGYAYYKNGSFSDARNAFEEAYLVDPLFSPLLPPLPDESLTSSPAEATE